ncbi:MAG: hypothetical protein RL722_1203 [Pseudomonadota bacterium]|jgi:ribosome-associated heat shock protein Hsp15
MGQRHPPAAPRASAAGPVAGTRLDKWLWAARFFKTRTLAAEAIGKGRILVDGQLAKAAREVRPGQRLEIRQGDCPLPRVVEVLAISSVRGSATLAQGLYAETAESIAAIVAWAERRRLAPEPADTITQGRPTKQARRELSDWRRWSAEYQEDPER